MNPMNKTLGLALLTATSFVGLLAGSSNKPSGGHGALAKDLKPAPAIPRGK